MAHPKRRVSKTRKNKRRTHYKTKEEVIAVCKNTGEAHVYHRAYKHEGKTYYKGKLFSE